MARRETTWNPSRFQKTEVLLRAKASAEPVDDFGRKVGVVSAVVFFFESGIGLKTKKHMEVSMEKSSPNAGNMMGLMGNGDWLGRSF